MPLSLFLVFATERNSCDLEPFRYVDRTYVVNKSQKFQFSCSCLTRVRSLERVSPNRRAAAL